MFVSSARGWVLTPVQMRAGVSTACRFLISAAVFCVVVTSRRRGCCINPKAKTATLMSRATPLSALSVPPPPLASSPDRRACVRARVRVVHHRESAEMRPCLWRAHLAPPGTSHRRVRRNEGAHVAARTHTCPHADGATRARTQSWERLRRRPCRASYRGTARCWPTSDASYSPRCASWHPSCRQWPR